MKSRFLGMCLWMPQVISCSAASYTNNSVCGCNLISNPLGVNMEKLIVYPGNFSNLYKWNQVSQSFDDVYTFALGAWIPQSPTLGRGESALYVSDDECPSMDIVTAVQGEPILPIPFTRNSYRAVSRQVPGPGTYENIVGLPPEVGSKFIRFDRNQQQWTTNTFNGSTWLGGPPTAEVGEGVLIYFPPVMKPLAFTNFVYDPANGGNLSMDIVGTSNVLTRLEYATNLNSTNWITVTNLAPSTGTFRYTTNGVGASQGFYRALYAF